MCKNCSCGKDSKKESIQLVLVTEGFKNVNHFTFDQSLLWEVAEFCRGLCMCFVYDGYHFRRVDGSTPVLPEVHSWDEIDAYFTKHLKIVVK